MGPGKYVFRGVDKKIVTTVDVAILQDLGYEVRHNASPTRLVAGYRTIKKRVENGSKNRWDRSALLP